MCLIGSLLYYCYLLSDEMIIHKLTAKRSDKVVLMLLEYFLQPNTFGVGQMQPFQN